MLDLEKLTFTEIINGYFFDERCTAFVCVCCGKTFEIDEIFKHGDRFFTATRAIQIHIQNEHANRLNEMLNQDSKYLSLTDNQKELLGLFAAGLSDNDVAKQLNLSPSTVRHQRFMFREKAKSAKMYLAMWEMVSLGLTNNKNSGNDKLLPVHIGAKMIDERYEITVEESKKIMDGVFYSADPLKLKVFSPKEKKKIVILRKIAEQFEKNKQYTEKEVNSILADIYEDYATIRRYLIEYGYMDRTKDGKAYWLR